MLLIHVTSAQCTQWPHYNHIRRHTHRELSPTLDTCSWTLTVDAWMTLIPRCHCHIVLALCASFGVRVSDIQHRQVTVINNVSLATFHCSHTIRLGAVYCSAVSSSLARGWSRRTYRDTTYSLFVSLIREYQRTLVMYSFHIKPTVSKFGRNLAACALQLL